MDNSERTGAQHAGPPRSRGQGVGSFGAKSVAAAWRDDRDYLLVVASRILRDDTEAEDIVAEAFARLDAQPTGTVRDARGWLIVVTRRLALDQLRSAHLRLSEPVDPTEPHLDLAQGRSADLDSSPAALADPADRVTLDDEIRRALSVVVDQLTPGERAAFILHDVFDVPFDEIGVLVGRSAGACRQLASRARATIRATGPGAADRTPPPANELDRVAEGFSAACADGDVARLATLLHHDVSGWAIRDGVVLNEVHGRDAVSAGATAFFGPRSPWGLIPFPLDDAPAVLVTRRGEPAGVIRLVTDDSGLITQMHAVLLGGDRTAQAPE